MINNGLANPGLTRNQASILFAFIGFFGILYTGQVVINHYLMRTYALDYGFYNQAFRDFAHFRSNYNTVMEPCLNYFQVHPGFTLLLLSPLYHLFNPVFGTYSLLIIQNIFILIGGYCCFRLIFNKSGNFWIALLAFIHFNVIWGHYSALASDFIEATIGASMVPVFLLFFDRRRYVITWLTFLFILACKENMPIWFIFISIVLFITYKDRKSRKHAIAFTIFSIFYLILLFKLIIPAFEDPEIPYWGFAYSALGDNPAEAVKFLIGHPLESIRLLFVNHLNDPAYNLIKKEFYIVFLFSGGLLLFRRPVYILPFIPIIAQKMYNDSFVRWGISGFYSIEVVSILTVFAFLSTLNFRKAVYGYLLYGIICISSIYITYYKMESRHSLWYDYRKEAILKRDFYQTELNVRKIRKQIRQIVPENSALVATQSVVPHFSEREKIHIFPYVHEAEYMVFLNDGNTYPLTPKAFETESKKYLNNPEWTVLLDDEPLVILKRKRPLSEHRISSQSVVSLIK